MFGLCMWWLGMFLEALLLVQGLRTMLISRFPLFYSYLLAVLVQDVIRYTAYQWYYTVLYKRVYWTTQFVSLVMGSIIIFEIYRIALQEFPGTARMARNVLRAAFLFIFVKTLVTLDTNTPALGTYVKLERDLRMVQTVGILILVVLFLWYGIPLARNLAGILLGYSIFVALSVVQLSIVNHYESKALKFWAIVQPVLYVTVLGVWTYRLWVPDGGAVKEPPPKRPGSDYGELASSTNRSLEEARARLGSAVRP